MFFVSQWGFAVKKNGTSGRCPNVDDVLTVSSNSWLFPTQSCMRPRPQIHTVQSDSDVLEPSDEHSDAPTNLSTYLEPECIIGSTDRQGELMFLVKWWVRNFLFPVSLDEGLWLSKYLHHAKNQVTCSQLKLQCTCLYHSKDGETSWGCSTLQTPLYRIHCGTTQLFTLISTLDSVVTILYRTVTISTKTEKIYPCKSKSKSGGIWLYRCTCN